MVVAVSVGSVIWVGAGLVLMVVLFRTGMAMLTALSAPRQRRIIAARDGYERGLREIIDEGIRRGEFRRANSKIAVFAILGSINWIARWYRPEGPFQAPELGRQFAEHLVGGLTCRRPQ